MNVLLVHHTWPGASAGGSETYTRALARALVARGHRVTALHREADAARPDHVLRERDEDGVRVIGLNNLHRVHAGFEAWNDPAVTARAGELVRALRPDVVHVGHLSGLSAGLVHAARAGGAAVVFTLHDFATLCALGQLLDLQSNVCPGPSPQRCLACVGGQVAAPAGAPRGLARFPGAGVAAGLLARTGAGAERIAARLDGMRGVLAAADVLISPSRFLRDRMEALGVAGIEVVPYGHEPLRVERRPDPDGRVRFGFLGSVIPSKGVHVLADAFRRLGDPRATLRIHGPVVPYHGDTTYEARLRALLGPAAGDVLRGPFAHEDRAAVLGALDVLVAPSLWEENAPLVVQEAFQAGLPVIASGHGGLAEAVRHDVDGLWFRPGDADALADAMRRMLEGATRSRLAANVPSVEPIGRHAERVEGVYERARERYRTRAGRVGVVVVDHGRPDDTRAALASAADPSLDVVALAVANGTPAPAGARTLQLEQNLGYAAGANAGVRALASEGCGHVLVLNNDARLAAGALRRLAEAMDAGVAAAGPTVVRTDGAVESRGMRLDLRSGRHRMIDRAGDTVDALSGAALMVSVEAHRVLGGFDEAYFHGFEDADFCLRARRAGWRLAVVPEAVVEHASGATLGRSAPQKLAYAVRNHLRLVERLEPGPWWRAPWIVVLHVAHALRQGDVPRVAALKAVARGVASFRAGRTGSEPA